MDIEERNNLFEKFLKNGMSIEEFKFRDVNDKKNLFAVLEEYLKAMLTKGRKLTTLPNIDDDITIYIDDVEICMFSIDYDYRTARCFTLLEIENEDLIYCLTMFFLTVKELRTMIGLLSKGFSKLRAEKGGSESYGSAKNGKYKTLPANAKDIVNKISTIQDSILKNLNDNKKYIIPKDKK
tara:strand:+ start:1550 stop:2092 length:543 start_codon:yes stop_codon:yes gene_type:complete